MKTIDEQIENAKKLLEYLEKQKEKEDKAVKDTVNKPYNMPEYGQKYYSAAFDGLITHKDWKDTELDRRLYAIGNVYFTKEDAEFEVERRKVEFELRKYIYEHGGGNGEFVVGQNNWFVCYYFDRNEIKLRYSEEVQLPTLIYSNSAEVLHDAVKVIGAERIKIYYLRVKEG